MTFTRCFAPNPSFSFEGTFSFGAIWDLFLVEHMNGPNRAQQMNGPNRAQQMNGPNRAQQMNGPRAQIVIFVIMIFYRICPNIGL